MGASFSQVPLVGLRELGGSGSWEGQLGFWGLEFRV